MPPGDGKLKPEDEIILAVVLSIVAFAILSFTYYKIRTHTKALHAQQRQQDVERNGAGPPGPGGGGGGGRGCRGTGKDLGLGEKNRGGLGIRDGGSSEKSWTAGNIPPRRSVMSATDNRSRRSGLSDSGSGSDKGVPRLYVEHKVELEGDMKAPDEIDGKGLSAARDKIELEGSGPPVELPVEPMRFSWAGLGTGTMGSAATTGTFDSMTRSTSAVSDATTLFRYSHKPSYSLRVPRDNSLIEEREKESLASGGNRRLTELYYGGSSSAMRYRDVEISPVSPAPRSVRTFSLDGTVVEAQLDGCDDWNGETTAAPSSTLASAAATGEQSLSRIEPAVLRKDKWKVWRALAEETRRKH